MKQVAPNKESKSPQKLLYTPQLRYEVQYLDNVTELAAKLQNGKKVLTIFPFSAGIVLVQEYYE